MKKVQIVIALMLFILMTVNNQVTMTIASGDMQATNSDTIWSLDWHPNGDRVAVGRDEGLVEILDPISLNVLASWTGHTGNVQSVAWSPDGAYLVTGGDDAKARIWDSISYLPIRTFDTLLPIDAIDWHPTNPQILTGASEVETGYVSIWDLSNGLVTRISAGPDLSLEWSQSGTQVLITQITKNITIRDSNLGLLIPPMRVGENRATTDATWSPNDDRIAISQQDFFENVVFFGIWERSSGNRLVELIGHTDEIRDIEWSPGGDKLASASVDGTVRIWDATTGENLQTITHPGEVYHVDWNPEGTRIVYGGEASPTILTSDVQTSTNQSPTANVGPDQTDSDDSASEPVTFECIRSFEEYAYGLSGYEVSSKDELDLQWQPRFEVPRRIVDGREVEYILSEVLFSRIHDSQQEVWVKLDTRGRDGDLEYGVYNAITDEFRRVPASIDNLNLVADQLFVDFNGTVWGIVEQFADENDPYSSETGYYPNVSEFFALAYFDDAEQRFKLATGEPKFAIRKDELRFVPRLRVAVDSNLRIFWLFDDTNIYQYEPQAQTSTHVYDFSDDALTISVIVRPGGGVYFSRSPLRQDILTHQPNSLYVFEPEVTSVYPIDDPLPAIPNHPILFVDQQDRLWLGPTAYRYGATGLWQIVHPDLDFALEGVTTLVGAFGWGYPKAVLVDSADRIWFSGSSEPIYGASGLAWYDPDTGHGCSNIPSTNVIEDADGKLWFFSTGGTLYQSVESVIPR